MAKLSTSNIRHHDNLIINGDMRIAQRGTSFTSVSASQYTLDRWKYTDSGTTSSVVTITQDTDVPTGEGFVSSLKIDVTTAESGSDADELQRLLQYVEAQNLQHLEHGTSDAKELHLSWWFKSDNKTGTMCVTILSHDAGDMLLKEFTVPDNNWNKYTWVIPANTAGGPANDTGQGFSIQFVLNTGSNYHTTEKTDWTTTVADYSTSNQTNFLDNTSNNLWFTGVQLVVGNQETGFDFKTPGEQLALCQRYYEKSYDMTTAPGTATDVGALTVTCLDLGCPGMTFKTRKRSVPTITIYDDDGDVSKVKNTTDSQDESVQTVTDPSEIGCRVVVLNPVPTTSPARIHYQWTAYAEL